MDWKRTLSFWKYCLSWFVESAVIGAVLATSEMTTNKSRIFMGVKSRVQNMGHENDFFLMLGKVQKVSIAGENNDNVADSSKPLLDDEAALRETNQMLLAVAELDYQEDLVRQREAGIQGIQRDVNTIHGLFQDVAVHVSHQGQMLDSIEANVAAASDRTREANSQLAAANRQAPSTRRNLKCILIMLLMIIIILVLLKDLIFPRNLYVLDRFIGSSVFRLTI